MEEIGMVLVRSGMQWGGQWLHFLPCRCYCVITWVCCVWGTLTLQLSGSRLSGSPTIRIGLDLRVNLSRILQIYLALKLPIIGSNIVRCLWLLELQIRRRCSEIRERNQIHQR